MSIKKKNLVTSYGQLKYPTNSELVFIDEFLLNLYTEKERAKYKCSYANSLKDVRKNVNPINNSILIKKLIIYKKKLRIF